MDMELVLVPFRTDDDGNEVVTFAFRPVARADASRGGRQVDVAIVGVGLHPFGRFGDRTGIDMGAIAIRRALADAGVAWRDIQFAFAGSYEIDNPDAVVALLGLTGIPFTNVYNGCATAASVLALAADTIRLGEHDLGSPSAWTSTFPARSAPTRGCTPARRGTASSATSSPRSSSG